MDLKVVNARISRFVGKRGSYTTLSFKVVLDDTLDRLDLETGEIARSPNSYIYSTLQEQCPDLFVSVLRASGGRAPIDEGIGHIGTVLYSEAWSGDNESSPSSITFRLYLSDDDYERLLVSASNGVPPTTFLLNRIEGIEESGPDGNKKKWDNKANPILPIDEVSWNYNVAAPALPPAAEPPSIASPKKPDSNRSMWVMWIIITAIAVVGVSWIFKK